VVLMSDKDIVKQGGQRQERTKCYRNPIFCRCGKNPILTSRDLPFRALAVLNPGAVEFEGQVLLLLRVEDVSGYSRIHVARSENGITDWDVDEEPLLDYGLEQWRYETWGCEDARAVYVAEDDCYYISYVAYSGVGPAVGLARTTDFRNVQRLCLLGSTNDKDGVLFPCKFDGNYAIYHRPVTGGRQHIWSAYSPDLIHWGEPHCVLREGDGPSWDGLKVGAGPPPILTEQGWLQLFHGVKEYGGSLAYRVGAALIDRDDPHTVLGRTRGAIFHPEADYEVAGHVPNVVFPTGAILRDGEVWMYYGAADTYVCLATAPLADILKLFA
jgi:predicted GH43/DUF377 family glycosyl hydrolase